MEGFGSHGSPCVQDVMEGVHHRLVTVADKCLQTVLPWAVVADEKLRLVERAWNAKDMAVHKVKELDEQYAFAQKVRANCSMVQFWVGCSTGPRCPTYLSQCGPVQALEPRHRCTATG